ncbi:MipA/OmpV family protein [Mesorhizobium sp.]|uniref:MipA/OmpV family protein n=1 Tax=Mesorhizobium sp. TaxID=1871066 RepID=UPI002DDCAFDB|nr:MipA/OmpV family protein [Mesorhizobium sp.]
MRLVLRWVLAAGVSAILLGSAQAADSLGEKPIASNDPWIISVGGMMTVSPKWDGSSRYSLGGMPSISFRRASEPETFSAPDDNFDITFFTGKRFAIGPVASLRPGRSSEGGRLEGLDSYPWTVEAGVFAEFWPIEDQLRLRGELRHGLRSNDGFSADLGADYVQNYGQLTLSGGPRMVLADDHVMNLKYGISPEAALRNGTVAAFDPKGGIVSVGLSAAQSYVWSKEWTTTLYQRFDYMVGDAADSPIVKDLGSRNQFTFGVGATYSFTAE